MGGDAPSPSAAGEEVVAEVVVVVAFENLEEEGMEPRWERRVVHCDETRVMMTSMARRSPLQVEMNPYNPRKGGRKTQNFEQKTWENLVVISSLGRINIR